MIAVILARGGSKGIKGKNLISLAGKPLLYYTLNAALNASSVSAVALSSDSDEILEFGAKFGAFLIKRPENLASDFASSADTLAHALQVCKEAKIGEFGDILFTPSEQYTQESFKNPLAILLQPTSPFRTSAHIDGAYERLRDGKFDSIISVKECDNKLLKAFTANEFGELSGVRDNVLPFTARQKLPKTYMSNGAIYIVNATKFIKHKSFMQGRCGYYAMDEMSSFDIDSMQDLKMAEEFIKRVFIAP